MSGCGSAVEVENNRILRPQDAMITEASAETRNQVTDSTGVSAADRRHVDNLPLDQLDPGVVGEHPGLAHAVVVGHGKPMASVGVFGSRAHDVAHEDSQFSLSCANHALNAWAGHYSSNSDEE
jgi:hypothetical protein